MKNQIKLKRIDLKKGTETRHPDIEADSNKQYLAKIEDVFYCGFFSTQHFGLNFHPMLCITCGFQYDKPGHNYSRWKELYEIRKI